MKTPVMKYLKFFYRPKSFLFQVMLVLFVLTICFIMISDMFRILSKSY